MNTYPILERVFNSYSGKKPKDLSRVFIAACQHILEPQAKMFSLITDFGVPRKNIFILGKAYSTSVEVLEEMKGQGFNVNQPEFIPGTPFDIQHKENCEKLFQTVKSAVPSGSTFVVLDDGAMLLSMCNERREELRGVAVFGVEQTSSGFRRLETETLGFPVTNVARSAPKLNEESVYIAYNAVEKMRRLFDKLQSRKALVVGLGPIGKAIVRALEDEGFETRGFDVALGHTDLAGTIASYGPSLVVGATGWTIMTLSDLASLDALGKELVLVSVSSSDREFPVVGFRNSKEAHRDIQAGKNILIANGGFPISFQGNRSEIETEMIEPTIAQLLGSVLYWATRTVSVSGAGLVDVPDEILALLK